jgi:drug/metabolite transporter (DMT)-like permease
VSAIIAAILFGSVSTVTKPVLENLNAFSVSSITYLIAGISLVPFLKFSFTNSNPNNYNTLDHTNEDSNTKREVPNNNNKKNYLLLLLTSFSGAVIAPTLFFYGLSETSASDSSILINGEILFSILLAIVFFNEKLIRREIAALILVLVGILILATNMQFLSSSSYSFLSFNIGNILIVGSTLFWALDNNISKILSKTIHILKIIVLKTLIGGSILFILFIIIFGIDELNNNITILHIPYLIFAGSIGFGASLFFFLHLF